jgi:hypothetical protein
MFLQKLNKAGAKQYRTGIHSFRLFTQYPVESVFAEPKRFV